MPGLGPIAKEPIIGRHGGSFSTFGDYSVSLFEYIDYHGDPPSRPLFDMVAVAILKNKSWGEPKIIPAPILINNQWTKVPPKTAVFAPRNSVHAFRNPNSEPLEMLIQTIPGGFDLFFAECAAEFENGNGPNMDAIVDISARYGIYYPEL